MFLIKTKNKLPNSRWVIDVDLCYSRQTYKVKPIKFLNIQTTNLIGSKNSRKIFLKKLPRIFQWNFIREKDDTYITGLVFDKTLKKEYAVVLDIFSNTRIIPSLNFYYPGFKLMFSELGKTISTSYGEIIDLEPYKGLLLPLQVIPLNFPVSNLYNRIGGKVTYITAPGSKGFRQKEFKKSKLIEVTLPSGTIKLFNIFTKALFGVSDSLNNKLVEGKWGSNYYRSKSLAVRGVAKNPVDHPNGGRTKAKQPERSPWGWIAKKCK